MSRSSKIILGILSFLPIILMIFYMGAIFNFMLEMAQNSQGGEKPDSFFVLTRMSTVLIWALVLGILDLGLKIYFIIHAINNKLIEQTEKILWVLVFIFLGMVGFPAYWISRIRNTPDVS